MDRLLSEKAVLDAIEDEWHGCTGEYPASTIINDTCQRIEELPTAEPERTGEWELMWFMGTYKCTNCGEMYCDSKDGRYEPLHDFKFCPNCGAHMIGVENGRHDKQATGD